MTRTELFIAAQKPAAPRQSAARSMPLPADLAGLSTVPMERRDALAQLPTRLRAIACNITTRGRISPRDLARVAELEGGLRGKRQTFSTAADFAIH